MKYSREDFIKKSNIIHNNKYNYDKIPEGRIHLGTKNYYSFICPIHGEFQQLGSGHLTGYGCKQCGFMQAWETQRKTTDEWVYFSRQIHGDRYDYSKSIYTGAHKNLIIICPDHGDFNQTASNHTNNKAKCPICAWDNRISSHGEHIIENLLLESDIIYIKEMQFDDLRNPKTNRQLRYDFYLPEKNTLIEFDGPHHFELIRTKKYGKELAQKNLEIIQYRDKIKTNYAQTKSINLIRIKYNEDIKSKLFSIL